VDTILLIIGRDEEPSRCMLATFATDREADSSITKSTIHSIGAATFADSLRPAKHERVRSSSFDSGSVLLAGRRDSSQTWKYSDHAEG
jgi:hypothetical protein